MPNWCYNSIDIYGESSELQKFVEATKIVGEDGITGYGLSQLFPIPQELVDTTSGWHSDPDEQAKQTAKEEANIAKYGYKDWYDWACDPDNWGTKWGDSDFDWTNLDSENLKLEPTDVCISAYYQTAWSPADGLIRNISAKFPSLTFSVVSTEESDAFACYSIFRDGKLLAEGGEEPKRPKELTDENSEDFYDKLNDWQTETFDRWSGEADKALGKILIDNK